jgi:hypothetical protein
MKALLLLFTIWTVVAAGENPHEIVLVPTGKPVMLDGKIESGEWSDATEVQMPNNGKLYLKRSNEFLYVAVQLPASRSGFTDLYLASEDGAIDDLHASAKLGERRLENGKWPEWTNWWNNQDWVANVSRVESFQKRTFLPATVREYQIRSSHFRGSRLCLRLEMSLESRGGKYELVRFPASASDSDLQNWLRVDFEQ